MKVFKPLLLVLAVAILHIEGMTCGACATSARIVLEKQRGVTNAKVSYATKNATVRFDPAATSAAKLAAAVEKALPYKARVVEERK